MVGSIAEGEKDFSYSVNTDGYFAYYINAALRPTAQFIYDSHLVNAAYAVLDALIISYSVFKYYFDMTCSADVSSSDAMHDWMISTEGKILSFLVTFAIIGSSISNNVFGDVDDKNDVVKAVANDENLKLLVWIWPYFRDIFKGLKFSYKGMRTTLILFKDLSMDWQYLLIPVSLVLGVLAAGNRILYRNQVMEPRKRYLKSNIETLAKARTLGENDYELCEMPADSQPESYQEKTIYLKVDSENSRVCYTVKNASGELVHGTMNFTCFYIPNAQTITVKYLQDNFLQQILYRTANNGHTLSRNNKDERDLLTAAIQRQDSLPTTAAMFSSAYAGFADGLYTYMGVFGLAVLSSPVVGVMACFCVVFIVVCMVNRCYEEYEYQTELRVSEASIELIILSKEIEQLFWTLQKRSEEIAVGLVDGGDADTIRASYAQLLDKFKVKRYELNELRRFDDGRALLKGLRAGLFAYSVICSVMFFVGTFFTVTPLVLLLSVLLGALCLLVFAIISWCVLSADPEQQKAENKELEARFNTLHEFLENKNYSKSTSTSTQEQKAIIDCMTIDPSPQYPFQEIFETLRSGFSGLGKGPKAINFCFNALLEPDSNGKYQDAPWMTELGILFSVLYAVAYFLKTFGKQLKPAEKDILPTQSPAFRRKNSMFADGSPTTVPPLSATLSSSPLPSPRHDGNEEIPPNSVIQPEDRVSTRRPEQFVQPLSEHAILQAVVEREPMGERAMSPLLVTPQVISAPEPGAHQVVQAPEQPNRWYYVGFLSLFPAYPSAASLTDLMSASPDMRPTSN